MAIDYYQSEPPAPEGAGGTDNKTGSNSALLPKSLVGEVEPGSTVTLTVLHVYDDEVEVGKTNESNHETEEKPEEMLDRLAAEA